MKGVADLERTISLALASAYVTGEKPISLMIVSDRPESGKTEVLSRFDETTGVALLSDATAHALWRDFEGQIRLGLLKHILIPEFLAPISRNTATVGSWISTLQVMIEEGIKSLHTGSMRGAITFDKPMVVGVIACLPQLAYWKNRATWMYSGFLSRFLVVSYKYPADTVDSIFNSIMSREYMAESKITRSFTTQAVEMPLGVAEMCKDLSMAITASARESQKIYGFRELKSIMRMVTANVVLENAQNGGHRTKAEPRDFDVIQQLSYLYTEQFNEVKQ